MQHSIAAMPAARDAHASIAHSVITFPGRNDTMRHTLLAAAILVTLAACGEAQHTTAQSSGEAPAAAKSADVVSLDAFRKK